MNLAMASKAPTTRQDKIKYFHKPVHKQRWTRRVAFVPQNIWHPRCWNRQHESRGRDTGKGNPAWRALKWCKGGSSSAVGDEMGNLSSFPPSGGGRGQGSSCSAGLCVPPARGIPSSCRSQRRHPGRNNSFTQQAIKSDLLGLWVSHGKT